MWIFHAHGCTSDLNCSLNGVCKKAKCECDAPWSGDSCAVMLRKSSQLGGMYGFSPNVSSWGGNPVKADDGTYHLYVAEMAVGGLKNWGSKSECTHAISANLSGPYQKVDEAVPIWCHNPNTIRDKNGTYLLFHIGNGNKQNSSNFLHYSFSPNGPWIPGSTKPKSCNNPAPAFHPNGTLFCICNHLDITYASSWNSTWAPLRNIGHPSDDPDRHWEDPFLWFDRGGNWHILYHVYCLKRFEANKECYSGHAFSINGYQWTFSPIEPHNGTVHFIDGSSKRFATRERPHILFADESKTTPAFLITGVSPHPVDSSCDRCKRNACSQCKVTTGMDWTYTQMEPLLL